MNSNKLTTSYNITENGITIIGDTFTASSGFNYAAGYRNFGKLKIVEEIAGGTAVTFLCNVKVFDENGTLIIDKSLGNNFHYERETARLIVLKELLNMLDETQKDKPSFNKIEARKKVDRLLKEAYYESSYKSVSNWAKNIGLI